ncbi:MAG: Mor transcription activator family protein [Anaerocolumna sp.]
MNEGLHLINLYELSEDQRELANCIGVEGYYKLTKRYGGSSIYIARPDAIDRQSRNDKIIQEYEQGATYKQLASKYRLSTVWIRNIVDGKN